MNNSIHANRLIFNRRCQEIAAVLSPLECTHLRSFLFALTDLAKANATVSLKKRKWMQFAYWRVVATYCRHIAHALNHPPKTL